MSDNLQPAHDDAQLLNGASPPVEGTTQPADRRVFICYSRRVLSEVAEFEAALRECLQSLGINYTVFRDVTDVENASIAIGENWRSTLTRELDRSVCCVVILIPAIFDRPECVREIEYFQQRVDRAERCFFFPIVWLPVSEEIARRPGHPIARILGDLQQFDFSQGWSETEPKRYKRNVLEIAQRIDRRVRDLERLAAGPRALSQSTLRTEARETGDSKPGAKRRFLAAGLAAIAVILLVGYFGQLKEWWGAPPTIVWTQLPQGARIANATGTPVATYDGASRSAARGPDIGPGTTIPAAGIDQRLERAHINGELWLRYPKDPLAEPGRYSHVLEAAIVLW
jgi:hypothetical protein